jgi:prophage antirepressor-like protein
MLTNFIFEGKTVRFVGTAEIPEWVAQDVCECLEIKNSRSALEALKDSMRGVVSIDTTEGIRNVNTVFESGLYKLIFKSRKKVAEKFQDWIFEVVLPEIRKTGSYNGNKKTLPLGIDPCRHQLYRPLEDGKAKWEKTFSSRFKRFTPSHRIYVL